MSRWISVYLSQTSREVEEAEMQEEPWIVYKCVPISPNKQNCELLAIVPEKLVEEIFSIWEEIRNEEDELEIAKKLITIIVEIDDNPHVRIEFDNYFLRIEINPQLSV